MIARSLLVYLALAACAFGQYEVRTTPGLATTIWQNPAGPHPTVKAAFERAFQADTTGVVTFAAPGTYTFESAATVSRSRKTLVIPRTVTIIPSSDAVGIATFTGNEVHIGGGGTILIQNAVADGVVLKMDGGIGCSVTDLIWRWTATGLTRANPMIGLLMEDVTADIVARNRAFPVAGSIPFKLLRGDGSDWHMNQVRPEAGRVPESDGVYVDVYVPYWIQGMQMGAFRENVAYGLGGEDDDRLEWALLLQWDATASGEQGHNDIYGNRFEACYAKRWIGMYGGRFNRIYDNLLGQNEISADVFSELNYAASADDNHAAIHGDSSDFTSSGGPLTQPMIYGNDIHNFGGGAPFISIARAVRVHITDNVFGLIPGMKAINIDGATVANDLHIKRNHFDGTGTHDRAVYIYYLTGALAKATTSRIVVTNNTADGFDLPAFEPMYGQIGPYEPFGFGFDSDLQTVASTISFESIATSSSDYPKVLDATVPVTPEDLVITAHTITRGAGSWITDGFKAGATITIASSENAGENDGDYLLAAVSATTLTITGNVLVANADDDSATLDPNRLSVLRVGDYIYMTGAASAQNQGLQKVRTVGLSEIELELLEYTFPGPVVAAINDLATAAATPAITINVYRRGLTSNVDL